jgi:Xaa-Pro dipeptidase
MTESPMPELADLYRDHIERLQRDYSAAMESCGVDHLVISAGQASQQRSVDDQYWPLKPSPSFLHWLPEADAGRLVSIRIGKPPALVLHEHTSFWEGPAPTSFPAALERFEHITRSDLIAGPKSAFVGDDLDNADDLGFAPEACNRVDLQRELDAVRAIKSPYEIHCIAEANRIASRGHARVAELFTEGDLSELALHLHYLLSTSQVDGQTPYQGIVAHGRNAAVLHHVHYDRRAPASETSLLVDAGASFHGYASDITRTWVRGRGEAAERFRALVAGVEKLQAEINRSVRPGLHYENLHNRSHELLAEVLLECELAAGSAEALVERGVTRAFFPHGLGHSLGLQVHDVGCRLEEPADHNPFLRNTSMTRPGQVFTIEPGCYFIDGLLEPLRNGPDSSLVRWDQVDRLRPFGGVRIEDNLAVTEAASSNLTRDNWASGD